MFTEKQHQALATSEAGFASLIIGLVLILVLALMTVGFAELARHEQTQALNHQLSTQAYYAAETGVNDVSSALKANVNAYNGDSALNKQQCLHIPAATSTISPSVSYTCAMLTLNSPTLTYSINKDGSKTTITNIDNGPLRTLHIVWQPDAKVVGHNTPRPVGLPYKFTDEGSWASPPVLAVTVTPLSSYDRSTLMGQSYTVFLYPSKNGANNAGYSAGGEGDIVSGACTAAGICNSNITFGGIGMVNPLLIHIVAYYVGANPTIISGTTTTGAAASFSGGQATIDVTGKAKDVLKRIRVTVPLDSNDDLANYAIEAQAICKHFETQSGKTQFVDHNLALAVSGSSEGSCALD